MRTLLCLALLLPSLALAAPTHAEWAQATGKRRQVLFTDGSTLTGTIVSVDGDEVRLREDDGSMTTFPATVVDTLTEPPGTRTAPRPEAPPPPPPEPVRAPRGGGPSIGLGVGVGTGGVGGGVGVGIGTQVGGRRDGMQVQPTAGREWDLVGVRYPLRGGEIIDWIYITKSGQYRGQPADLDRNYALREYVFVDQWGRSVPWQSAWAAMGAEDEYIERIKKIDNTMIGMRAVEGVLGLGGLGLMIYTYVDSVQKGQDPYGKPTFIAGSAMVVGNIAFSLGVTGPTRNRMRVTLGRAGIERADQYFRAQSQ